MVTTPRPSLTADERALILACLPDAALNEILTLMRDRFSGHVEWHYHIGAYSHWASFRVGRPDG